jgi:hypothetical protein
MFANYQVKFDLIQAESIRLMSYTYSTLNADFQNLEALLNGSDELYHLRKISLENNFKDEFDVCLGLSLLGIAFERRHQFLTNRYFLDALNIKLMPAEASFNQYLNFLNSKLFYGTGTFDIENHFNHQSELIKSRKISHSHQYFGETFYIPKIQTQDLEFLSKNGYLVIPNAVPEEFCDQLYKRIFELAEAERNSDKGGYIYGLGNSQRIYHLIAKDKLFWKALTHPLILELMDYFFERDTLHDRYYLTSYHANILNPGAEPQILHVDAAVPEPLPQWIVRANSNILLQDYTSENGATEIVPGSHLFNRKPTREDIEKFPLHSIEAKKGSLIVWHGHLWHRSGKNSSKLPRAALLGTFCASHFREMCLEENPYLNYNPLTIESLPSDIKNIMGWSHGAKNYT